MKERERLILSSVLALLLLTWLGFLFHSSPDFAGSGLGSAFGIAGAVLMLIPLAYPFVKRIAFIRDRVTKRVSLQTMMTWHVYAGIFGPLLAIIHTGHKFESWLGITLTAVMLLCVVSGFALRYLTTYVAHDMKDKLLLLQTARGDLDSAWGVLENSPAEAKALPKSRLLAAGLGSLGIDLSPGGPAGEVTRLADSVADLEFAIRTDELFKRWFSYSLKLHIVLSILLYVLLGLHIWAGFHFGLRWLS
ncbi:hypothetical protein [Haloferula sp.]|uniref:hypothetical protein n=1 Tax=Haloferula sp. TaxID=2497595 RepID=UPI003C72B2CB